MPAVPVLARAAIPGPACINYLKTFCFFAGFQRRLHKPARQSGH